MLQSEKTFFKSSSVTFHDKLPTYTLLYPSTMFGEKLDTLIALADLYDWIFRNSPPLGADIRVSEKRDAEDLTFSSMKTWLHLHIRTIQCHGSLSGCFSLENKFREKPAQLAIFARNQHGKRKTNQGSERQIVWGGLGHQNKSNANLGSTVLATVESGTWTLANPLK